MKKLLLGVSIFILLNIVNYNRDLWNVLDKDNLEQKKIVLCEEFQVKNLTYDYEELVDRFYVEGIKKERVNERLTKFSVGEAEGYLFYHEDENFGKIKIQCEQEKCVSEILEAFLGIAGVDIVDKEMNIKYQLKEPMEKTMEDIIEKLEKEGFDLETVPLNRGKEIIIYNGLMKKIGIRRREGHMVFMNYGEESFLIVGEKEIIIDF